VHFMRGRNVFDIRGGRRGTMRQVWGREILYGARDDIC
jgi:hypothetical protein